MAQYAKTAQVRQGILDACLAAFGDVGFHGSSMAEIARRAGISHTGLLHHFPRKEDLLTAVLELEDERSATFLKQHSDDPGSEASAILSRMISMLVESGRPIGLVELNATLTGEATSPGHPAHAHFAERYVNVRRFMTRLFTALEAEGRLSTTLRPNELATVTIAVIEGTNIQRLYGHDSGEIQRAVHAFLTSVVRDLRDPTVAVSPPSSRHSRIE